MKKTKPEPRSCPVCGDKVGLSADSVRVHLRLKHPGALLARRAGCRDGEGFGCRLGCAPRQVHMRTCAPGITAVKTGQRSEDGWARA